MARLLPNVPGSPVFTENIFPCDDGKTTVFNPEKAEWFFYHDCLEADKNFALARLSNNLLPPWVA